MSATIPPIANSETGVVTWTDVADNVRAKDFQWLQARSIIRFTNLAELEDYPDSLGAVPTILQPGQVAYLGAPQRLVVKRNTDTQYLLASTNLQVSESESATTLSFGGVGGLTINSDGTVNLPGGSALDLNNLSVASGKVVLNATGVALNTHGGSAVMLSSNVGGLSVSKAVSAVGLASTGGLTVTGTSTLGAVTASGVDVSGTLTATTVNAAGSTVILNSSGLSVGSTLRAGSGLANGDGVSGTVVNSQGVWTPGVYAKNGITIPAGGSLSVGGGITSSDLISGSWLRSTQPNGQVNLQMGSAFYGTIGTGDTQAPAKFIGTPGAPGSYWEVLGPKTRAGGVTAGGWPGAADADQAGARFFIQSGSTVFTITDGVPRTVGDPGGPEQPVVFQQPFPNGVFSIIAVNGDYTQSDAHVNVSPWEPQAGNYAGFTFRVRYATLLYNQIDIPLFRVNWIAIGW